KFGALVGNPPAAEPSMDGYLFMGWYKDADGKEAFDFSVTMPNGPLAAYAKWKPNDFTLTYYDSLSATALPIEDFNGFENFQPVGKGLPVDFDDAPYQPGDIIAGIGAFEGWYVQVGNIWSKWPADRLVTGDLNLYAGYLIDGFVVTYITDPGTPAPIDADEYWLGRQTRLSYGENVSHPEGKVLIGWTASDTGTGGGTGGTGGGNERGGAGALLTPGDYYRIQADTTFTAVYADRDDCIQIVYHSNYPGDGASGGETVSVWVLRGSGTVALKGAIFTRVGASLVGWMDAPINNVVDYELGEVIAAPTETKHVYGHWVDNVYRITFVAGGNGMLVDSANPAPAGATTILYDSISGGTLWNSAVERGVPVPTPSGGYEFVAWHLGTITGAVVELPPAGNPAVYSNLMYVAEFQERPYTVTYVIEGGTWVDGTSANKTETVKHGDGLAAIPNNMTPLTGYLNYGSWDVDPNQYGAVIRDGLVFTYTFQPVAPVTITVNNASKLYGTADTPGYNGFTVSGLTGDALAAFIEGISIVRTNNDENVKRNAAGAVEAYEGVLIATGYPESETLAVTVVFGSFTIIPRSIVLASASDGKVFDNTPLTNSEVIETGDGFADGEGIDIAVTGTITNPGSVNNTFTWSFRQGTIATNYDITPSYGLLVITSTENSIVLSAGSGTQVYDGSALINNTFSALVLPSGVTHVFATVSGSQTAAGSSNNIITNYALYNGAVNVTANYSDVTLLPGTLTVTPRPVTITVNNATKTLGATDPTFTGSITSGSLVSSGDLGVITYARTNTVETAGTYARVLTARYVANTNYVVTVVPGNFTITAAATPPPVTPPTTPPVLIPDAPTATTNFAAWALVNLILAVVGMLAAVAMLVAFAFGRKENDVSAEAFAGKDVDEGEEKQRRKRLTWRIINVAAGVAAVILFLLTEDITLPMTLVDSMTIWQLVVFVFQIAFGVLALKKKKEVETSEAPTLVTISA
ncbi:MAG: InlB B-repeat-containing protein, partial [Coriobacteriia bacterium]|nr:InlB B-repeat-containing protein [Coriobacteriia bacterium]